MNITLGNLNYTFKRLRMAFNDSVVKTAIPVDPPLTPGESSVLEYLVDQTEAKSIREIVDETKLVQSWVSTVVKSLEKRGWVTVSRNEHDKRVTMVAVTKELKEGADLTLQRDANVVLAKLIHDASPKELIDIKSGLETLYHVLRRQEQDSRK